MPLTRRSFLSSSALLMFGCATNFAGKKHAHASFLYQPIETIGASVKNRNGIFVFEMNSESHEIIETPFNVHLLEISKTDPQLALGVNKYGPYFLQLDLQKKKIIRTLEIGRRLQLTGHMSFSSGDQHLCATAFDPSSPAGDCVALLNPKSFTLEDVIYLKKSDPAHHDCKFINDSQILATTGAQSIDFIDPKTKKVHQKTFSLKDKSSQIRHFSVDKNGFVAGQANVIDTKNEVLKYSKAQIIFLEENDKKSVIELNNIDPAIAHAELIDFAFNSEGSVLAAVHNHTDKVSFWSVPDKKLLSLLDRRGAKRVVFDDTQNQFVIISPLEISIIDPHNFRVVRSFMTKLDPNSYYSLSHKTLG